MQPNRSSQRTVAISIGGQCDQHCPLCECGAAPDPWESIVRRLQGGGKRLTILGTPENNPLLDRVLAVAGEHRFDEVIVRTTAAAYPDPRAASVLAGLGVDAVRVPLFSHDPRVHDRVAGREGALVSALVGLRSLSRAGLDVHLDVPILPRRLQRLDAVIELAARSVPAIRRARFYLPCHPVPAPVAPPPWSEGAPALAAALRACNEHGIAVDIHATDAIPLCALREFPEHHRVHRFDPRARIRPVDGCTHLPVCETCAVKDQCPGVAAAYHHARGAADIRPWESRPRAMYDQRTTPKRTWTDAQRNAARRAETLVLRPTVNCNQDCPFCSANESSGNVWPDPDLMRRQIARAARRRIERLSLSGGEPALSPHLASFVRVASRCGIDQIEIVTNGALLARQSRVQQLVDAGLTHAFVSLHAHTETLSRTMTQKVGDFDKTVSAIHHFIDGGVTTTLNHVIGATNFRYLENYVEFVHHEFDGRVAISFAFMTPQFKALANMHLVPRLSDVAPYLKRALYRAVDLRQPFVVGSRQGVPPCVLGEFAPWSDVLSVAGAAISEDQPQKQRAEACDRCMYTRQCTGLWKPYVAVHGLGELSPIPGDPIDDDVAATLQHWGDETEPCYPPTFADVPARLRNPLAADDTPPRLDAPPALDGIEFVPQRSRPLRTVMFGSGRQARRLAVAASSVSTLTIDAVVSPHAPDGDTRDFGNTPTYRSAQDALDDVQPDVAIIAAATHVHHPLTLLAVERGIPVLVEKPFTRSESEAEELVGFDRSGRARILMAHNVLFAPGLDEAIATAGRPLLVTYRRRAPAWAPGSPTSWEREALYQALYHTVALVAHAAGGGPGEVVEVQFRGDSVPERVKITLAYPHATVDAQADWQSRVDDHVVTMSGGEHEVTWHRDGTTFGIRRDGVDVPVTRDGSEHERMLRAFAATVLEGTPFPSTAIDGLTVMRTTREVVDALEAAGAPMHRPSAPRHVASKVMQHPSTPERPGT